MDDPKVVATGHSPLRPNQPINGLDIPLTGISTPHNVDLATSPTSAPVPFFPPAANATQPQTMAPSTSPTLIAIPSPALTQPTLDSVFREYLYRSCRDSLFWLEAERYRQNPVPQKATFILRTFFTEGGEFYLTREDFPSQFDALFSKQRPANSGQLILEVQDFLKTSLIQSWGPSFSTSPLFQKFNESPSALANDLTTPSKGGCLSVFLAPRPMSTIIQPGQIAAANQGFSPTNAPAGPGGDALWRNISPPLARAASQQMTIPVPDHLRTSPPLNAVASSPPSPGPTAASAVSPRSFVAANPSHPRDLNVMSDSIMGSSQHAATISASAPMLSPPALNLQNANFGSSSTASSSNGLTSPRSLPVSPNSSTPTLLPGSNSLQGPGTAAPPPTVVAPVSLATRPKGIGGIVSASSPNLDRRASRGSLVDETITSSRANKVLVSGSSPAPIKPSSQPARVNVIQLVGAVRDKVGLAKKDKERREREKYFDPTSNGWMFMEAPSLDDLIQDANIIILFYDFLKTIHAEENLTAWIEIELYKASNAPRETRRNIGVDLLVRFFEPTSKSLINIEGVNYKDILKELNERPSRDLFDVAQRVLWDQLAFQCFVRFKESEAIRRLFEETTIKGKKKELLKLAQRAVKSSNDNSNFMIKLEEFAKFKAGYVAFVPNVSDREFQLEDVLYSSDLLVAFREYLNLLPNSLEYLDGLNFWFEVEVWKYSPRDNFKEVALNILREYLLPTGNSTQAKISILGYDTKTLEIEINERPDKNTFARLQFWVWRKLKLEQFLLFEHSETLVKFFAGDLPMRQNLPMVKHCDTLNDLRARVANDVQFKANTAKVQAKIRVKRQEVQGTNFDLDYLLADREYVQILCEFMDKRQARENLAFWTEAEFFKYLISPGEKAMIANKIWERFFSDKAEVHINVDTTDKSNLQSALKNPTQLTSDLFVACQDTIYALIAFDLIPKFSVSEHGARLLKAIKRRPPNTPQASFKVGGIQAVKDLRSWLGSDYY